MNFEDEPRPRPARVTIIRNGEVYRYERGEDIPRWLRDEADAALREGRADVSFGEDEP